MASEPFGQVYYTEVPTGRSHYRQQCDPLARLHMQTQIKLNTTAYIPPGCSKLITHPHSCRSGRGTQGTKKAKG